jgi:hypothetical protein
MPLDLQLQEALTFIAQAARAYAGLIPFVAPGAMLDEESLGGKLLFVGELNTEGRALLVAGNIAGAASLAASADPAAQKQAIRNGSADFLVTNLDEALRILKNEIRKRQTVSVAVSIAAETIVKEMQDRGVLPDLLSAESQSAPLEAAFATFIAQGAQRITDRPSGLASKLLVWRIPEEFAQRPSAFDAMLMEHIPPTDRATLQWLRSSPRYLGPHCRRLRSLTCDEATAAKLMAKLGSPIQN